MRQEWCIGLRLPVQLRANNHFFLSIDLFDLKNMINDL